MDTKLLKTLMKKKTEETTPRLASLRLPRDLSLGGTKPKKVFVPNVNVVRNKDKDKDVLKNLDKRRKDRTKSEPKNRAFKNSPRFIQSSGIFSDGAAEQRRSTAFSERSHYNRSENDSVGNAIAVPTINKKNLMVDKQKEDIVLDELMRDDDEIEDEKKPLMPIIWRKQEDDVKLRVKEENQLNGLNNHTYEDTERRIPYFHKIDDDENNYRLALLKLPDSLAGKGLSDDPNETKIFDYPLNVMLEGKVGTLQIRRSGRMYVKIGHVKYLLESTDFFSSNESVAVLGEPSPGRERPNLAMIGNIEEQFVLNPIWKCLLKS